MSGLKDVPLTASEGDAIDVAAALVREDLTTLDPALAASVLSTELMLQLLDYYDGDLARAGAHAHQLVNHVVSALVEPADSDGAAVH